MNPTPPARLQGFPPVIARPTRLLILGSFPGEASLRAGQYYAHPRNQFWPLVGGLLRQDLASMPYRSRLRVLRATGLGLWDVYASCRRQGSLDQAIEDAEWNDFASLRRRAPHLVHVAHNGGESARAGRHLQALGFTVWRLPSTSPAHASWSLARKREAWAAVFEAAGLLSPGAPPGSGAELGQHPGP